MTGISETRIDGRVGVLTIDEPPVNALSASVRRALIDGFRFFESNPDIDAVVLICGGRTFIAGFDITEFDSGLKEPPMQEMLDTIAGLTKPAVAAIHGTALGGGFEIAMLCSHRIAVPSASVGLPEVLIGLIPGAGGTQLLPRMVGPALALELLTEGRHVGASEALELGLVDALADEGDLERHAIDFARRIAAKGEPLPKVSGRQELVEPYRSDTTFFAAFRERKSAEFRGFSAPEAIIKAVEAAVELPIEQGLDRERELISELMASREFAAQRYAFFAERDAGKIPGMARSAAVPNIRSVGIAGSSPTASAITALFRSSGVATGVIEGEDSAGRAFDLTILTEPLSAGTSLEVPQIDDTTVAIVAVTSGLAELDDMAVSCTRPERLIGLNFLPDGARLVEVVHGTSTDKSAIASVIKLLRRVGRVPILCGPSRGLVARRIGDVLERQAKTLLTDGIGLDQINQALFDYGFAASYLTGSQGFDSVNVTPAVSMDRQELLARLMYPLINEGAELLEAGIVARASDIDMAAIHGLGWPVFKGGPMFWAATVGVQVVVDWLDAFARQHGEQFRPRALLRQMAANDQAIAG